jgi:hypothetical protein
MTNRGLRDNEVVIYRDTRWKVVPVQDAIDWIRSRDPVNRVYEGTIINDLTAGVGTVVLRRVNNKHHTLLAPRSLVRRLPSSILMEASKSE